MQANGQLAKAADFRPMIVAYRNGNPVRLEELGHVLDSVQNDKAAAWFNNTRAVVLAVQRQPGANTVAVVDSIRKLLPQFRETDSGGGESGRAVRPFAIHPQIGDGCRRTRCC